MGYMATLQSYVFTQKFPIVENEEHFFDFVLYFYFLSLCFNALSSSIESSSISQWVENQNINSWIVGVSKVFDQKCDGVSKNDKSFQICIVGLKIIYHVTLIRLKFKPLSHLCSSIDTVFLSILIKW